MNTFEFALDLSKQTAMEPLRLRQGDKNGTEVRATIYDHGTLVTGSYTSRICLSLPDGEHYYRKAGTFSAGVATVTIDEQEAASVVGRSYGYIQLLSGSTVIASTASFPVLVLPDATANATVPESYDTAIQEAIDGLNEAVADLPDTVEEILDQHHEWTTTVQDNSLTDAKLIQSGGILSRNQRLMYRLANLLTHRTDEGTLAAISDAAKTPMAGLSVYGQSTQDGTPTPSAPVPIVSVEGDSEGNISLVARGKNLYHQTVYAAGSSQTINECTFTYVDSSSIIVNGTSTVNTWKPMHSTATDTRFFTLLPAGTYTASKSTTQGRLNVRKLVNGAQDDVTSTLAQSVSFTLTEPTLVGVTFVALSNQTFSNLLVNLQIEVGSTSTEYIPYVETVTPIDLDGHELRSLPDGTRDELTVDAEGHVTLVQRVGVATFDGTESVGAGSTDRRIWRIAPSAPAYNTGAISDNLLCDRFERTTASNASMADGTVKLTRTSTTAERQFYFRQTACTTAEEFAAWLANNPTTVLYQLATPVIHDLGTVPLVPLVGPDLTAQTVPTAPFVLDAERDLNVTLARLESAIAALA